MNKSLTHSSL